MEGHRLESRALEMLRGARSTKDEREQLLDKGHADTFHPQAHSACDIRTDGRRARSQPLWLWRGQQQEKRDGRGPRSPLHTARQLEQSNQGRNAPAEWLYSPGS